MLRFGVEHIDPIRNPRRLNAMTLWHQTGDAPCRVSFGDGAWWLDLEIGTWPVEAGQSVSIEAIVSDEEKGVRSAIFCDAVWKHNKGRKQLLECKARALQGRQQCRVFAQGKVRRWTSFTCNVLDAYRTETLARHPLASASADVSRLRTLRREGQLHAALGETTLHSRLLLHGGVTHLLPKCSSDHQSDPGAVAPDRSLCRRRMSPIGRSILL